MQGSCLESKPINMADRHQDSPEVVDWHTRSQRILTVTYTLDLRQSYRFQGGSGTTEVLYVI